MGRAREDGGIMSVNHDSIGCLRAGKRRPMCSKKEPDETPNRTVDEHILVDDAECRTKIMKK